VLVELVPSDVVEEPTVVVVVPEVVDVGTDVDVVLVVVVSATVVEVLDVVVVGSTVCAGTWVNNDDATIAATDKPTNGRIRNRMAKTLQTKTNTLQTWGCIHPKITPINERGLSNSIRGRIAKKISLTVRTSFAQSGKNTRDSNWKSANPGR
jgi:hypothetical protein